MCCNLRRRWKTTLYIYLFMLIGSILSRKLYPTNTVGEIIATPQLEDDTVENSKKYEVYDRKDLRGIRKTLNHANHCEDISIHKIVTDMFTLNDNITGKRKVKTINLPVYDHTENNVEFYKAQSYEIDVGCFCMDKHLKSKATTNWY